MKIIRAKYILTCDEKFTILKNASFVFDEKIIELGTFKELNKKYPQATFLDYSEDFLLPSFINPHIHLEFSSNRTSLAYGDFLTWLKSIIRNRESLSSEALKESMEEAIKIQLESGVGTLGEISSFKQEAELCANSKAKFVFFSELLGTDESQAEEKWQAFQKDFERLQDFESPNFINALSLHSPYSTCRTLTEKACAFARENSLLISSHLYESSYEKDWIEGRNRKFASWLSTFYPNPQPFYSSMEDFLSNFKDIRTLFTHCCFVKDFSAFDKKLHSITSCGTSNRLLSKPLNIKKVLDENIILNFGTDGLSSNISLNFFDELRTNLFLHDNIKLKKLAKILLLASTAEAGKALNLKAGIIKKDYSADFSIIKAFELDSLDQLALQIILQSKSVKNLFLNGEKII